MNKALIALGVVAVGAGGYFYAQNQQQSPSVAGSPVLDAVPADSIAVSLQFEPINLDYYLSTASTNLSMEQLAELTESDPASFNAQEKFFFGLYQEWVNSSSDINKLKQVFGLGQEITSQFYMLGMLPVLKIQLENPQAFLATLDKLETEHQFAHRAATEGSKAYRAYPLVEEGGQTEIEVIFAVDSNTLTIAFNVNRLGELNQLPIALGEKAPENPLSATTTIKDLQQKYPNVTESTVGYLDIQELTKGITSADGNLLSKQLTKLAAETNDTDLALIRTPECKADFQGIAANWPRLVWGGKFLDKGAIDAKMVMESNNKTILTALQAMRGFIANMDKNNEAAFSMGVGLDVNSIAPSMTSIVSDILQTQYQCAPLAQIHSEMAQANPAAMAGMAAGFINGLKGLSVTLFDYQLNTKFGGSISSFDGAFSLSADNPQMLLQSATMVLPELAQLNIPNDGTPVTLPPELTSHWLQDTPIHAAYKGNHFVVYSGEKSDKAAKALFSETMDINGVLGFTADYQKMMKPVIQLAEQEGEELPEEIKAFAETPYSVQFNFDVTDNGLSFDVTSQFSEK